MNNTRERNRKAESGNLMAQCEKGECYFGTDCVPKDHEEAANWCMSGEYDMCFTEIIYNLGLCCYRGKCVTHNYEEAYFWVFIAAENDHKEAKVLRSDLAQLLSDKLIRSLQESAIDWFNDNIVPYLS